MDMINISSLNDQRLKEYKKTLYRAQALHYETCECCKERHIHNLVGYNEVADRIKAVSIEQMSRRLK
ncbi:hypothetical protein PMW_116 [Pseudomonas phage phiPMW]|uniref:Uncharacterized protein n=1 Tax=Pseudomonas phage phiPMW TaxID=1815582 RepID=A0A1S5R1F0_9CAUD|nr:hypothetical protein FDG97_gp116 [Pseudomonas phage phiPMW]ANA49241.1 hypothetical protein PMW_116 [Pseudomonas phage phiPMW]